MNSNYQTVLNYLQKRVRVHYSGEVIIPPVIAVSEALKISLEEVEAIYQELLERCVIRQFSDFEFVIAHEFPMTDQIRMKIGTVRY